jgi:hypothetical protein
MLAERLGPLFAFLVANPEALREKDPQANAKLYSMSDIPVGAWNPHEAVLAKILEENGIPRLPKFWRGVDGVYYIHKPNAHKKGPDFQIVVRKNSVTTQVVNLSLKYSTTDSIQLSNEPLEESTLYIFSWNVRKGVPKCLVGFGSTFLHPEEVETWKSWTAKKREINQNCKPVENLQMVLQYTCLYSCKQFTEDKQSFCLKNSITLLQTQPWEPKPKVKRLKVQRGHGLKC